MTQAAAQNQQIHAFFGLRFELNIEVDGPFLRISGAEAVSQALNDA